MTTSEHAAQIAANPFYPFSLWTLFQPAIHILSIKRYINVYILEEKPRNEEHKGTSLYKVKRSKYQILDANLTATNKTIGFRTSDEGHELMLSKIYF